MTWEMAEIIGKKYAELVGKAPFDNRDRERRLGTLVTSVVTMFT